MERKGSTTLEKKLKIVADIVRSQEENNSNYLSENDSKPEIKNSINISNFNFNSINPWSEPKLWTIEEDNILLDMQESIGNKWATISKYIPGRNEIQVKNRFKSLSRANRRLWTRQDDELLLSLRQKNSKSWEEIMTYFPKRTRNNIKKRYSCLINANGPLDSPAPGSPRQALMNRRIKNPLAETKPFKPQKKQKITSSDENSELSNLAVMSQAGALEDIPSYVHRDQILPQFQKNIGIQNPGRAMNIARNPNVSLYDWQQQQQQQQQQPYFIYPRPPIHPGFHYNQPQQYFPQQSSAAFIQSIPPSNIYPTLQFQPNGAPSFFHPTSNSFNPPRNDQNVYAFQQQKLTAQSPIPAQQPIPTQQALQ